MCAWVLYSGIPDLVTGNYDHKKDDDEFGQYW